MLNRRLYKFNNKSPYLISHQPSIINKDFLIKTLEPNESPWENEIKGTKRLKNKKYLLKCLGLYDNNIYLYEYDNWYKAVVRQGKYTIEGERLREQLN